MDRSIEEIRQHSVLRGTPASVLREDLRQLLAAADAYAAELQALQEGILAYRCVWPETKTTLECDRWAVREWERKHSKEVDG